MLMRLGDTVTNLFSRLHRWLHRQDENFVTETLAFLLTHLLEHERDVGRGLGGWLCGVDTSSEGSIVVKTQVFFTDKGIPDIEIAGPDFYALVEAKKWSGLGENQLPRYRDILKGRTERCRSLALVTVYPLDQDDDQPD